ncbi:MAG: ribosome small subunit-dependent GTPase A [Sulfobacillus acidophilus]|uniref:Small ribosomal subunit biogenesis GTPase RsgA n=1 Tax=Sulfobacillus acidophilus TaxID=53633 RepID=A0A2T2WEX1_9FIRM|nr:MAG: ribosome small subunit-dependent GTPase A [Sulfobacillus acidophilus]
MEGLVTLLEANRPTVAGADGLSYLCYLKGRIKRDVGRVLVGDRVVLVPTDPGEARIDEILPRTNQLLRPPVANVTGLFVVFTLAHPVGNLELLDKRLVMAKLLGLEAEVVLSKVDLLTDAAVLDEVQWAYQSAGFRVWRVSSRTGLRLKDMVQHRRQGIWVLTGESGAGKSTLLNAMIPQQEALTQALGRTGRGQQTTRWVRLYRLGDYWLADSPGYTALTASVRDPRAIASAFEEFSAFTCRFANCLHGQEPDCTVRVAVAENRIPQWRYRHYRKLLSEWVRTY